ncbi:unnamed protein product [Linum trigynum]|uniref:Uncharacterized protein n=1 Tax=Linum trigynum TaxID=586398 RepID=A0AAV2GAU9_9ROSI
MGSGLTVDSYFLPRIGGGGDLLAECLLAAISWLAEGLNARLWGMEGIDEGGIIGGGCCWIGAGFPYHCSRELDERRGENSKGFGA